MYLTRNEIETSDSRDLFGSTSFLGSFYQMGKISVRNMHSHVYPGEYLRLLFYMTPETINHQRKVYNLLDLLGDLGGVIEVIMVFFGIFLYPVSKHSFIMDASRSLFLARTKQDGLFISKRAPVTKHTRRIKQAIKDDREIIISPSNHLKLFVVNQLGFLKNFWP